MWIFSNLLLRKSFYDSILQKRKGFTYDKILIFLQELFTTIIDQNEKIIKQYIEQKDVKNRPESTNLV